MTLAAFSALVGRFVGGVLAECAPVLVSILSAAIKKATTKTAEDGAIDEKLKAELNAILDKYLEPKK